MSTEQPLSEATLARLAGCILGRLRRDGAGEKFRRRARLWARQTPAAASELRARARDDREDRFILPSSGGIPVFAGSPPRWHDIPTGDNNREFLWELNRHHHWERMLRVHALDGDDALPTQVLSEWENWILTCPVPPLTEDPTALRSHFDGGNPWRALEAGLRMEHYWNVPIHALSDQPQLTQERFTRLLQSFQDHGRVLAFAPPRLHPRVDNNHYLSEMIGLLTLALTFPELPEATAWREQAWREIGRSFSAQFTAYGGQVEGCPHYHVVCLNSVAKATLIGREHGLTWSAPERTKLELALRYALHACRPNGVNVPWGDSDVRGQSVQKAVLLAALALDRWDEAAILRGLADPADWDAAVAEALWSVPVPETWAAFVAALPESSLPLVLWERELDQVMLRTVWNRSAASVFTACHSPIFNAHAHIDPASFDYSAFGRVFVADPGRFTYAYTPERYDFKSAAWHSTVTVDERDPFAYIDSWTYGPQQPGRIVAVGRGPDWQGVAGEQHSFSPAIHRRVIVLLEDSGALVVIDRFSGLAPSQTVQLWFHLDSTQVTISSSNAETADPDQANLRVIGDAALNLTALPGRVSDRIDCARASTRLRFTDCGGPAFRVYSTLLIPRRSEGPDGPPLAITSINFDNDALCLTLNHGNHSRLIDWKAGGAEEPILC